MSSFEVMMSPSLSSDTSVSLFSILADDVTCASSSADHSSVAFALDHQIEVCPSSATSPNISLTGHSGRIFGLSFLPSSSSYSGSSFLLSCSQDCSLRLWDLQSEKLRHTYNSGHVFSVWAQDISPLGMYFASASRDTTAKLWTFDRDAPLRLFAGHSMDVDAVKFHPNCRFLATGSSDRTVRLWSISDGKVVRLLSGGHWNTIFALAFSPDGQYLASAGNDRRIRIWDLRTNRSLREYRGHTDIIKHLTFDSSGSLLVSCSLDGTVKIWDASTRSMNKSSSNSPVTSSPISTFSSTRHSSRILYSSFSAENLLFSIGVK